MFKSAGMALLLKPQGPRLLTWGCSAIFSVALLRMAQNKGGKRMGGRAMRDDPPEAACVSSVHSLSGRL